MARRRRKYNITGDEYTFGGGGASGTTAAGGTLRIAKGSIYSNNANFDGYLSDGDTVVVKLDANTAIQGKDQYIYFDNAFETNTGTYEFSYTDGATALPAGVSTSVDNDSTNTDVGYYRIYGTPSTEGTSTFSIKYYDNAGTEATIYYELSRFPAGTTPVWSSTPLPDRIIRNLAAAQVLASGPTTTQTDPAPYYTIKDISGFATGVTPVVDSATGEVTVSNVGDIEQAASAHSFTVVADLGGEVGEFEQTFTGNIAYGDPYGARYFGPANANANITSTTVKSTVADSEALCNPAKASGALRRVYNNNFDTSPYLINDGYGCEAQNPIQNYTSQTYYNNISGYAAYGYMGHNPRSNLWWASSTTRQYVRFKWEVPTGVTSIAAVCVGAGSYGAYSWAQAGGGGGGLAWMNGISVTPGQMFTIQVGLGMYSHSTDGSYGGGDSFLWDDDAGQVVIYGQGGGHNFQNSNPNGQNMGNGITLSGLDYFTKPSYSFNQQNDGGGWGVNTSYGSAVDDGQNNGTTWHYGGGCGAATNGRYGAGAGGYRGNVATQSSSNDHSYGGGGSGYDYSSTWGYGAGGGVGLDGQGSRHNNSQSYPRTSPTAGSGTGGYNANQTSYPGPSSCNYYGAGGGGSGGSRGVYGENPFSGREEDNQGNQCRTGGMHGGGGGGSGTSGGGGHGAPGGLRIIWGTGADGSARCFPYTYCSEKPSMKYNGES